METEDEALKWPPTKYAIRESYALIVKALVKLVSQVHQRLCRGTYTIDDYRKTFRCFNRVKPVHVKEEAKEPKKKKVVNPEAEKARKLL